MGLESNLRFRLIVSTCLLAVLGLLMAGCGGKSTVSDVGVISGDEAAPRLSQAGGDKPVSVPDCFPKEGGVPLYAHLWDAGSYSPNGDIVKWEWNFTDGGGGWQDYTEEQGDAWHTYSKPGTKAAQLRVTDVEGKTDVAHVKIEMRHGYNVNPIAVASADPTSGYAPLTVQFSATGSYDPDGEIKLYEWDFDEGYGFEVAVDLDGGTTYTYEQPGDYTAVLRVTDDDGAESTAGVDVTVHSGRGDWWMDGRNPRHTGLSPYAGAQTNNLKWDYDTSGGVWSNPTTGADGTIYVGTYQRIDASTRIGRILALNLDGTLRWEYGAHDAVHTSVAIAADGTLYAGCLGGYLYALYPDGTLYWEYPTGDLITSSPTIDADGTIYFGNQGGDLYALRPDGNLKWVYPTGAWSWAYSSPAIGIDGSIYFDTYWGGTLYAMHPDGTLNWSYYIGGYDYFASTPAVAADGTIYIGRTGSNGCKLIALDPTGNVKWEYATPYGQSVEAPSIDQNGNIYFGVYGTQSGEDDVFSLDSNGNYRWSYDTTHGYIGALTSPAIGADGVIYIGGAYFTALDSDGYLLWEFQAPYYAHGAPSISPDGTVYVGWVGSDNYTGGILAFGPSTD